MRILFTTILAFILSIMIGGMAAVQIAEITKAQEEFILAFMSLILVAVVATIAFAVAQARADPSTSIITTGRWSMALLAASAVGLIMWSVFGANPWPWVDPTTGVTYTLPANAPSNTHGNEEGEVQ